MGRGEGGGIYNDFYFLLEVLVDLKANETNHREKSRFQGKDGSKTVNRLS